MKKLVSLSFSLGLYFTLFGQTIIPSGIVSFSMPSTHGPLMRGNITNDWRSFLISGGDGTPASGAYIQIFPVQTSNYSDPDNGHIDLVSVGNSNSSAGDGIVFTNYDPSNMQYKRLFVARKDGKVLIGNDIWANYQYPGSYNLYVQNGILTEKVKVALRTGSQWADYVFDKDYKLMSLKQVDSFIKVNKHLPGIPSANEIVKEGLDLADMNAKLLGKIEELTLYIIELKKESTILAEKIKSLEEKQK